MQTAYGAQDLAALDRLATPEVVGFLAEELAQDEQRGVVNHIADVKLLQGDVAESWRERASDYATVAMRFALRDWTTDRAGAWSRAIPTGRPRPPSCGPSSARAAARWLAAAIQQA